MQENNPKLEIRKAIAAADEISIDLLQQLSNVAKTISTPISILEKLAIDPNKYVQEAAKKALKAKII